ncbi:MAG: hypothetical protein IK010_07945 [Bacteroidales bacterium]|nr:hypothetical protein [Bacteroidales bacterium]MBR5092950.1 hypothetical protein [Bacteroidales bacterium]
MKKEIKPKPKKYTLTLSEPEVRRLTAYAAESGIERPVALHRIVSQALRAYEAAPADRRDKRQLGLFDSVQIDIFNNTTKVQ